VSPFNNYKSRSSSVYISSKLSPSIVVGGQNFRDMERLKLISNTELQKMNFNSNSPSLYQQQQKQRDDIESDEDVNADLPKSNIRRQVLYSLWKGNYIKAKEHAKTLYLNARTELSKIETNTDYPASSLYNLIKDLLMYCKCLFLIEEDIETINAILGILNKKVLGYIKINYEEVKKTINEEDNEFHANLLKDEKQFEVTTYKSIRKILNVYGVIGAMYKLLENQAETERVYVKYCRIVEKVFGLKSIEASDCYFYIGVYYYEEGFYDKALICMQKALYNRKELLGITDLSCADCHFNIGMVYKRMNELRKAKKELEMASRIKREKIGEGSLDYARSLEELGKLALETKDYHSGFKYLQECYKIKKKILKEHKELNKVRLLLSYLDKKIKEELSLTEKKAHVTQSSSNIIYSSSHTQVRLKDKPEVRNNKAEGPHAALKDFFHNGVIFEHHKKTLDKTKGLTFLLSLEEQQIDLLNKFQISKDPNDTLLITNEIKKTLCPYQMFLYSHSNLSQIPRIDLLNDPNQNINLGNLNLDTINDIVIVDDIINEENVYKLIQSNYDFNELLNSLQIDMLKKVITNGLPLILFLESIQDNQKTSLRNIIQTELFSPQVKRQVILGPIKDDRGELKGRLIEFVRKKFSVGMAESLTTAGIVNDTKQLRLLTQIAILRNTILREPLEEMKEECMDKLKEALVSLINNLSEEQLTKFINDNEFDIEKEHKNLDKLLLESIPDDLFVEDVKQPLDSGDHFTNQSKIKQDNTDRVDKEEVNIYEGPSYTEAMIATVNEDAHKLLKQLNEKNKRTRRRSNDISDSESD